MNGAVREIRLDRKLKQSDVAKLVGVSTVTFGRFERNERQPRADVLLRIADVLNCDIADLLVRQEPDEMIYMIERRFDHERGEAHYEVVRYTGICARTRCCLNPKTIYKHTSMEKCSDYCKRRGLDVIDTNELKRRIEEANGNVLQTKAR